MKNLFCLMIIICFLSCRENPGNGEGSLTPNDTVTAVKAQDNFPEAVVELKNVRDIRKEHAYITSMREKGKMRSESFNYNCNEEKKGNIIYFYEKEQLRLIRHTYNEYSHFSGTQEYFIKDQAPFFVFYSHLSWNFIGQNQTEDKITEKRIYLLNSSPVLCLEKKFTITSGEKEPTEPNTVANEEIECSSIESILEDFELLFNLRDQREDIGCLEK